MARTARALALNDLGEDGDERAGDGRYVAHFAEPRAQRGLELVIAVDSPTFMREKRLRLAVHEPIEAVLSESPEGPLLSVTPQPAVMLPGARLVAWQEDLAGQRVPLALAGNEPGRWSAPLKDLLSTTYVEVSGESRLGNPITHTLGPLMMPGVQPPPPVTEASPVVAPPVSAQPETRVIEPGPTAETQSPTAPGSKDVDWLMPAIIFGAVNLGALLGLGGWFLVRRRRSAVDDELELEQMIAPQDQDVGSADARQQKEAA